MTTIPLRDGAEVTVSAPAPFAAGSQVLALADGRYVVAWVEDAVHLQFYAADGTPEGEALTPMNIPGSAGANVALAELADGRIVLVTDALSHQGGTGWDVYAQILSAEGEAQGASRIVSQVSKHTQHDPTVTATADGGFAVTWEDARNHGNQSPYEIVSRSFDSAGQPLGQDLQVPVNNQRYQVDPASTLLADGRMFVVWMEDTGANDDGGIRARFIGTDGQPVGADLRLNSTTSGAQFDPAVTTLANGNILVTWTDNSGQRGAGAATDLVAQILSPQGEKIGGEILVNAAFLGQQSDAAVSALPDGGFVIAWRDRQSAEDDSNGSAIRAQLFNVDGTARGDAFLVNSLTSGEQLDVSIAVLADGRFVISWTSAENGNGAQIKAQVFDPRNLPIDLVAGDGGETLQGGAGDDALTGGAGNDTLISGGGLDTLTGGQGNDTYVVDGRGAQITEDDDDGVDVVQVTGDRYRMDDNIERVKVLNDDGASVSGNAAGNRIDGADGDDGLHGGEGNDSLYGGYGHDTLIGGAGDDRLDGGEGDNLLIGGTGDDIYYLRSYTDRVVEQAGQGRDAVVTILNRYVLDDAVEDLVYRGLGQFNGTGNDLANLLAGAAGDDQLSGAGGADRLEGDAGADRLNGGAGRDVLLGGAGADTMTGGLGADHFVLTDAASARGDVLQDFGNGQDKIDLSAFMSDATFLGNGDFTGTGAELRYLRASGRLVGDVDGDGVADWTVTLTNKAELSGDDFLF
jgi:Ca2+-binding RTX toxin-like protein